MKYIVIGGVAGGATAAARIRRNTEQAEIILFEKFAHYEQIKRFTLLPHPFSMERGELTNTLKIKRNVLNKNYAAEIEKMYEE